MDTPELELVIVLLPPRRCGPSGVGFLQVVVLASQRHDRVRGWMRRVECSEHRFQLAALTRLGKAKQAACFMPPAAGIDVSIGAAYRRAVTSHSTDYFTFARHWPAFEQHTYKAPFDNIPNNSGPSSTHSSLPCPPEANLFLRCYFLPLWTVAHASDDPA